MNKTTKGSTYLAWILGVVVFASGAYFVATSVSEEKQPQISEEKQGSTSLNYTDIDSETACNENGGSWGIWFNSPMQESVCNLPTMDAGNPCTDSDECDSYCKAPEGSEVGERVTGECFGYKIAVCLQEVRDGVADSEWCQ